jgi:hypothetical protein
MMTKEELENLINQDEDYQNTYSVEKGWKILKKTILDISIEQYYDEFVSDDAKFGLPVFYKNVQMFTDVTHQWKKKQLSITYVMALVGVPFINKTRATVTVNI